jgi:SAM-dependent methyltransferase
MNEYAGETRDTPEILDQLGFFVDGNMVLDIGCGVGFFAKWMADHTVPIGGYLGLDVRKNCVAKCEEMRLPSHYKFKHIDVFNPTYNFRGITKPEEYTLPVLDESVDAIICHSLFTHLDTEPVARRYMMEIDRVLGEGGLLWTTWFLDPPNNVSDGAKRTVYKKTLVDELLLPYERILQFGGDTEGYHDQFYIAVRKPYGDPMR